MARTIPLIASIVFSLTALAQGVKPSIAPMPTITQVHADFLKTRKTATGGMTKSIPPHIFYRLDGYDYLISLDIVISESRELPDTSLFIQWISPDESILTLHIEPSGVVESSDRYFTYSFQMSTLTGGWYKVFLTTFNELERGVDPKFYQEVSNQQAIYITIPKQ